MSLTHLDSFLSSGSSINPSIAWARGSRGEGRFRITFPLDSTWYQEQACTRFQSLEHRKERRGLRHEFIVLKLENGSICRIERLGDPDRSFNAIGKEGIVAHDIAQIFPPNGLSNAHLDTSDVVAKITFPYSLDLKIVLLICRAMQEGERTCKYTLQVFNCYFFVLAIQAALTRLVADWGHPLGDETWCSALGELSALSDFYNTISSAQDQQPFILRIYSAARLYIQWPAQDLIQKLKQELRQSPDIPQICNTVLWYTDMELAIDHALCRRVRDVVVKVLKGQLRGYTSQHSPHTPQLSLVSGLLLELISQAASRHEQELQMSKPSRIQRATNVKVHLIQEFERFLLEAHQLGRWTLGYCPNEFQSHPDPRQSCSDSPQLSPDSSQSHLHPPQLMPLRFSQVSQLPVWLIYAGKPVLVAVQLVILGLFGVDLLESTQPCLFVEDELESSITVFKAAEYRSMDTLEPMSQKLRSLVDVLPLVQWKQWPWDHIYQPIRQHTLDLLAKEERVLQISSPGSCNQAVTVSEFQEHLRERIRDHARRVESFRLGSATEIQGETEDRISQVWALTRADIDTSNAPLPPSSRVEDEELRPRLKLISLQVLQWWNKKKQARHEKKLQEILKLHNQLLSEAEHCYLFLIGPDKRIQGVGEVLYGMSLLQAVRRSEGSIFARLQTLMTGPDSFYLYREYDHLMWRHQRHTSALVDSLAMYVAVEPPNTYEELAQLMFRDGIERTTVAMLVEEIPKFGAPKLADLLMEKFDEVCRRNFEDNASYSSSIFSNLSKLIVL
ncbi:hypothetical protein FRC08_004620 [Ceratobasidium sp. 394]|nr:hypothetical protein FRC08_004620 [Ceratobasidium sp. 394]KAG9087658.1 hypothetical protein FS749_002762 [Ceratobasidium sp. UAMH 11750]